MIVRPNGYLTGQTASVLGLIPMTAQTGFARESWSAPIPAGRQQAAEFRHHQPEWLKRRQPQLQAWAEKGKPAIQWAGEPSTLPQTNVRAFPGTEGGGYRQYKGQSRSGLSAGGIPRWWMKEYELSPNDPALASEDLNGDGYAIMNKYLDGLNPNQRTVWNNLRSNVSTLTAEDFQLLAK